VVGVVLHRGARHGGNVSAVYEKEGRIRVREAKDDEWLEHGTVYIAPADHHLLFGAIHAQLSRGPEVHFARPAIDRLFSSAARVCTTRVAGLLLIRPTGMEPMA
jgi:two-component system chemotaxis response regulator CheB